MNRIKLILKEQGRTQIWLAQKLNMSTVNVSNYCNNKVQPPLDVLNQIAAILDVDIRELLNSTK
jgi:transcriptional regulator with XRE-family HTH domain